MSYAGGVAFAQAVHSIANQYKHYGEWLRNESRNQRDLENVTKVLSSRVIGA
jgi:hypothetical protein